jgi:hypothetical protein
MLSEGNAMAESWTVKGRIVVDHLLPEHVEAFGTREGVAGVTVKVSAARSKIPGGWGWWNSWGKLKNRQTCSRATAAPTPFRRRSS